MKKKLFLLTLIIFLTGCQKYSDLNDLAIIKSIGIEYNDNQYTLYAEIIDEVSKDVIPTTKIIDTSDNDIEKVFDNIKLLVNKKIYLSHIDLIILNPNLNSKNISEIINYFLENKDFRNDFLCVYSSNIKEILENSKYDEIEEIISNNKDKKEIINITFEEIIQKYLDNKTFTLSNISYDEEIKFTKNITFKENS